jgi:hypothetical protein
MNLDYTDVEEWYHGEIRAIELHAQKVEQMLFQHVKGLRESVGSVLPKRGDIRKAERCLSHAVEMADLTERISARTPLTAYQDRWTATTYTGAAFAVVGGIVLVVGLILMALSSFWIGFGLSVGGLTLLLVGMLIFAGSKRVVLASVAGIALAILLVTFVVLLTVLL